VFCIVFSFKTNFFFAKTRDGFEGVQRRGPVKGAGKFRVHRRPLTGSTAGITPVLRRRGLSGEKMEKKTLSAKNTASNFQATWKCGARGTLEQQETGWSDVSIEKMAGSFLITSAKSRNFLIGRSIAARLRENRSGLVRCRAITTVISAPQNCSAEP
jgi:hypothetical protein